MTASNARNPVDDRNRLVIEENRKESANQSIFRALSFRCRLDQEETSLGSSVFDTIVFECP